MPEPFPGRALYDLLEPTLSAPRLRAYGKRDDSDLDVLTRYSWNLCLCEALYPSLHALEIAFRNSLFNAIEGKYSDPDWLWHNPPVFHPKTQSEVSDAQRKLRQMGRAPEPDRVIAELTFGFWTSFLSNRYEGHDTSVRLWPGLLRAVFPNVPTALRNRKDISRRFERIRHLRNRISHHEPIWDEPDLGGEHRRILDALGWINPALAQSTRAIDRFQTVHSPAFWNQLHADLEAQSLALHDAATKKP